MVRPTKLAQMFASRACRTSVMVGKPLSRRDMKKVETQYYYGGTVVTLYPTQMVFFCSSWGTFVKWKIPG